MFEDENRIITSTMQHEDVDIENNLRPKSLDDYLGQEKAKELLIMGFIDRFREELPMEYAVELNALLKNYF